MRFGSTDLGSTPESVPRTIRPTGLPILDASADRGTGLRKERFNAAGDTDNAKAGRHFASPGNRHDRNREHRSKNPRGRIETDPFQSSDDKGWQRDPPNGAYRKIISLANSPKNRNVECKGKSAEGTATQDNIVSPSSSAGGPRDEPTCRNGNPAKYQVKGDQGTNLGIEEPHRQNSCGSADNSTGSSAQCSISPMSAQSSSVTDWEDRFVVNMPSAKEPNPPTLTATQISGFQSSIDGVQRDGGAMLDPETLPSPRSVASEEKHGPFMPQHQRSNVHNRYYSPDEVGKPRYNVTREGSPPASKAKAPGMNLDGSFLGCKAIHGPSDKNPDEILLFSPREKHQNFTDMESPIPRAKDGPMAPCHSTSPRIEEKAIVRGERGAISQNLKPVPCSKPSPKASCETRDQQRASPEISNMIPGEENAEPTASLRNNAEEQTSCHTPDDVFIITPTIRRTMITVGYMEGNTGSPHGIRRRPVRAQGKPRRPQMDSIPSALQPAMQNSQGKSTTPSKVSSKVDHIGSIPAAKEHADRGGADTKGLRATRGYIHTPAMVKSSTENFATDMRNNIQRSPVPASGWKAQNATPGRSASDSNHPAKANRTPVVSPLESPTGSEQAADYTERRPGRSFEIAELDGCQVDNSDEPQYRPRSKIIDIAADFPDIGIQADEGGTSAITLRLVFDIFVLSVAHIQRLYGQYMTSAYVKGTIRSVVQVAENCLHILMRVRTAVSVYRSTGSWPMPRDKDVGRSLAAVGLGVVNITALGFVIMVIGRLAWYVVLIGSWVVWLAKPFGWIFSVMGRMVLS
jgi:hypothetical protein